MLKCPECSGEISEARASCPSCGAPLDSSLLPTRVRSDEPARAAARGKGEARVGVGRSSGASRAKPSPDSIDDARFAPGYVLGSLINLAVNLPLAADFSVWYAPYAVLSLLLLAAPAIYGCYTSLGGQPLFSGSLLDRTESGR